MNGSETPETDALQKRFGYSTHWTDLARYLEDRLNAALKERDEARNDRDDLKRRLGEGPARAACEAIDSARENGS